jgi:hypothetical protein
VFLETTVRQSVDFGLLVEVYNKHGDFKGFHFEQARASKRYLAEQNGQQSGRRDVLVHQIREAIVEDNREGDHRAVTEGTRRADHSPGGNGPYRYRRERKTLFSMSLKILLSERFLKRTKAEVWFLKLNPAPNEHLGLFSLDSTAASVR